MSPYYGGDGGLGRVRNNVFLSTTNWLVTKMSNTIDPVFIARPWEKYKCKRIDYNVFTTTFAKISMVFNWPFSV